ncbi:hypothetical protein BJ741DRAFT_584247 [Chytriomyces cf. hyalinus JEL632]|nr:hypothetical protein BJ741DRAFT_584247 [Chytriomyces cf. hyalinus JEL632]
MSNKGLILEVEKLEHRQVAHRLAMVNIEKKLMENMEQLFAFNEHGIQCDELNKLRELGNIQTAYRLAMMETDKQLSGNMDELAAAINMRAQLDSAGEDSGFSRDEVSQLVASQNVSEVFIQLNVGSLVCTHRSVEPTKVLEVFWPARKKQLPVLQGLSLGVYEWDKKCRKATSTVAYDAVCNGGIMVGARKGLYSDDSLSGGDDHSNSSMSSEDTEISCTSMAPMR